MRVRVAGAVVFGFAVLVYVSGVVFESASLMAQGAIGAVGIGAAYAVYAGRGTPPAVRWALLGHVAAVAAVVAAELYWASHPTDFGWFAYAPASETRATLNALMQEGVVRQRWLALGLLVAAGCAVAAVWQLPRAGPPNGPDRPDRRRVRGIVAVAVGFGLLFIFPAIDVWQVTTFRMALGQAPFAAVADVVTAVWLPVAAAVAALVAGLLAVRRRAAWPAGVGAFLLGLWAVTAAANLARSIPLPPPRSAFLKPGVRYAEISATAVSVVSVDWTWAAVAAALVTAPVLVAVGCARATRARSRPGPPASTGPDQ